MTLFELLQQSADAAIPSQRDDGSMPPGHNGPYHHTETPVRNTAHWLITFLKVFELTGSDTYKKAAERAVSFLLNPENRPGNAAFLCLSHRNAHPGNGLIGQAWVIEALVKASEVLQMPHCYQLAEEIFLLHPWDKQKKSWHKLHLDGRTDTFDYTFNHQLWFAAAASLLKDTPEAIKRADDFTSHLDKKLLCYRNGIIKHLNPYVYGRLIDVPKIPAKVLFFYGLKRSYYYLKAVGYHSFNLYALAILKKALPANPFWKSETILRLLSPLHSEKFVNELCRSKYAFPYNPVGIEIAWFLETFFPEHERQIPEWLNRQFTITWDSQKKSMSRNTSDSVTSSARIYEATRLKNYSFEL